MPQISYQQFLHLFKNQGKIGSGSYGTIYKIRDKHTNQPFALKMIKPSKNPKEKAEADREIEILKAIDHPLVVKIFHYYQRQTNYGFAYSGTQVGFVMELGRCSLFEGIEKRHLKFSIRDLYEFLVKFIDLFAFLESKNIVHRDIKPENIIYFEEPLSCKMIDFNLACYVDQIRDRIAGSIQYLSPQLKRKLTNKRSRQKTNPFKDDVYSLGVTIYQLLNMEVGKTYFNKDIEEEVIKKTGSEELASILSQMLAYDDQERPTFIQLAQEIEKRGKSDKLMTESLRMSFDETSKKQNDIEFKWEQETIKKAGERSRFKVDNFRLKGREILSAAYLGQGFVLLGCQSGDLVAIHLDRPDEALEIGKVCDSFVSVLKKDRDGNVWMGTGDGSLVLWKQEELIDNLAHNYELDYEYKPNIFLKNMGKDATRETKKIVNVSISSKQPVKHGNKFSKRAVTCIEIHYNGDDKNILAGFQDGSIYALWENEEYQMKVASQPVTALRVRNRTLYCSSFDGIIKEVDLEHFHINKRLYQLKEPIISFEVFEAGISLVGLNGANDFINFDYEEQKQECSSLGIRGILDCYMGSKMGFALTQNGEIFDGKSVIATLPGRGWNCIAEVAENRIILGSMEGSFSLLSIFCD